MPLQMVLLLRGTKLHTAAPTPLRINPKPVRNEVEDRPGEIVKKCVLKPFNA